MNQLSFDNLTGLTVPMEHQLRVSVVIPAKNEEQMIERCLSSLARMHFPKEAFEVLVIDNNSTDRTSEVAQSFTSELNLRVVSERSGYVGHLRNLGVRLARGEFIAFLDADCLAPSNWLADAMAMLHRNSSQVLGARIRIAEDASWVARSWYGQRQTNKAREVEYVPTGDMLVKRDVFLELGGFDESLETNEDYEFCQRARTSGLGIWAVPELAVVHIRTPQTIREFFFKERWHGRHVMKVFFADLKQLRNFRSVLFTFYMFGCLVACAAGSIVAMMTGHNSLLCYALIATLLGPFALALKDVVAKRSGAAFVSLVILYSLFGIARVCALTDMFSWFATAQQPSVK